MELPSRIQFADPRVKKMYDSLKGSRYDDLYRSLEAAFNAIEHNAFCATQLPKRLIPKEYIKKYRINNLWKYDLPKGCRLLYSIEASSITVIAIILEWMDHKKYERRFNY